MPGIYGSVSIVFGRPTERRPVQTSPCSVCAKTCYRRVFTPGVGWAWRHYGCDAFHPVIERRRTRTGAAYGYVPRAYNGGGKESPV